MPISMSRMVLILSQMGRTGLGFKRGRISTFCFVSLESSVSLTHPLRIPWRRAAGRFYFYSFETHTRVPSQRVIHGQKMRQKVSLKAQTASLRCLCCPRNGTLGTFLRCLKTINSRQDRVDVVDEVDETLDQIKDKSKLLLREPPSSHTYM